MRASLLILALCMICLSPCLVSGQRKIHKPVKPATNIEYPGPCKLGLAQAPILRGFRLGMSIADIRNKFPTAQFTLKSAIEVFKYTTSIHEEPENVLPDNDAILNEPLFLHTVFTKDEVTQSQEFSGTDKIDLYFTAGKLTHIRVSYSDAQWWRNHDEFSATVANKLSLPEKVFVGGGGTIQTLEDGKQIYEISTYYECQGFQVQIITGYPAVHGEKRNPLYAMVLLTDERPEFAEVYKRLEMKKAEEKRRKEEIERARARRRETFKP